MVGRKRRLRVGVADSDEVIVRKIDEARSRGNAFVSGTDSRTLQRVVKAAARYGLEIRDPSGHLLMAGDRLNRARDYARHGARVRHRWAVQINRARVSFSESAAYRVERLGENPNGRRVVFDHGVEFDLGTVHAL